MATRTTTSSAGLEEVEDSEGFEDVMGFECSTGFTRPGAVRTAG
ncbi:hypothetical protein ACWGH3_21075 [Streptomyces sp. NPDC054884]|nr:hypothetical protein [Streptomyces sp. ME08-AFT2]MDX3310055.1 hypothetical protein [Streptomyces sp. ME08-AFT2]